MKLLDRLINRLGQNRQPSSDYRVVDDTALVDAETGAFQDANVARRQHEAYESLLHDMFDGNPRQDLKVAADAVRSTGMTAPTILDVGCGSGYYSVVFRHMVGTDVRYVGVDSSTSMIALAASAVGSFFLVGDATRLPMHSESIDIVFNGVSLMHTNDYGAAIREAARVSSQWCIFHTVPMVKERSTTRLLKRAYGLQTLELIFNESELLTRLGENGLAVVSAAPSIEYDLEPVLYEPTFTKTLLCSKSR